MNAEVSLWWWNPMISKYVEQNKYIRNTLYFFMSPCNSLVVSVSAILRWHSRIKPKPVRWLGTHYQDWQLEINLQPTYNVKRELLPILSFISMQVLWHTHTQHVINIQKTCKKQKKKNRKSHSNWLKIKKYFTWKK